MTEREHADGRVSAVGIRELPGEERPAAGCLLARAMCENALHIAACGANAARRECRLPALFGAYLPAMRRLPLVGYREGILVGILGLAKPCTCWPPVRAGLRVLACLLLRPRRCGAGGALVQCV